MTLTDACFMQANNEIPPDICAKDYINAMTNFELLEFLERVQANYGKEIE